MDASSNLSSDSTICTATMETCYGGADLISELPGPLLHLILSFLDMKLVVQTSILAKRWRYLWTTLPYLKFSEEVYCNSIASLGKMPSFEAFMDFVGRVLLLRNGSDVQSFYLSGKDYTPQMAMFTDKFDFGFEDFVYEYSGGQLTIKCRTFELPQCLFTFKSLATLDLDMGIDEKPIILELPHSVDLPSLRSLYLGTLRFVCGERLGKLISSSPVLEALFIINCVLEKPNNFTISALQLKKLTIHDLHLNDSRPEPHGITVSAPNLKLFHCKGMYEYNFDGISSLDHANVDVITHMDMIKSNASILPWEKLEAQNVIKFLRGLCNVKFLQLPDLFLEIVVKAPADLPSMITPFRNLSLLKITVYHSPCSIRTITIFLEKCPEVETLILVMGMELLEMCECFDQTKFYLEDGEECYSEAEVSLQCMLYHLKFVEILDVRGNVYELNLLGFLLKNAMILEKMTVTTSKELPPSDERHLEFKEMLVAFPIASSKAEVLFF